MDLVNKSKKVLGHAKQLKRSDPVSGFHEVRFSERCETALKDQRAKAAARSSSGTDIMLTRASDLVGFEKLLANTGNILSELAGIGQRAVDAASQVTHAVGVAETEYGRQFTQRKGRQLA
jgi:hypothetical protein